MTALQNALHHNPYHAPWYFDMIQFAAKWKKYDYAYRLAKNAVELEQRYVAASLQMGHLMRLKGESDKAKHWLGGLLKSIETNTIKTKKLSSYASHIHEASVLSILKEIELCNR